MEGVKAAATKEERNSTKVKVHHEASNTLHSSSLTSNTTADTPTPRTLHPSHLPPWQILTQTN